MKPAALVLSVFALMGGAGPVSAAEDVGGPPVHDSPIWVFVLADQLEHSFAEGRDALRVNALSWIGGDYNRLWLNVEGEMPYGETPRDVDVQALYGRLISPFWDLQAGIRYLRPFSEGPGRPTVGVALQGLAPYWFESQIGVFVSPKGEVLALVELEYDMLFTQRLIAQPRFHSNLSAQPVTELGLGRWISDVELGFRLRYEIMREFAPYVGLSWRTAVMDTADVLRSMNREVAELNLLAGIRLWY